MKTLAVVVTATSLVGLAGCHGDAAEPLSPPSIRLELGWTSAGITQGTSSRIPVTVACEGGYRAGVALTVTGAPPGVTAWFDPALVTSDMSGSVLVVEASAAAAVGTFTLRVSGSGVGVSGGSIDFTLTVVPVDPPRIYLELGSTELTLMQGQATSVAVNATRSAGFTAIVQLATSAPAGIRATLDRPVLLSGQSQMAMTVVVDLAASPGVYTITVDASAAGAPSASASLILEVIERQPTPLTVSFIDPDDFVWVVIGDTDTWGGVHVTRGLDYHGPVTLLAEGLPTGVTATFDPPVLDPTMTNSAITFTAAPGLMPSSVLVTIRAKGVSVPDGTTVFRLYVLP